MKIISKYKDYYDYVAGIYGIDQTIVYERKVEGYNWLLKEAFNPDLSQSFPTKSALIAICGTLYFCFIHEGKHYFGDDIMKVYNSLPSGYKYLTNRHTQHLSKTEVNRDMNCPIVLISGYLYIKNIKLSDWQIASILPPEKIWVMISEFLTKEEVVIDTRTDIEKIEAKGFDKKKSFRK